MSFHCCMGHCFESDTELPSSRLMLAYFCVTALSLLFFNQCLCNFTHQLPFHNLQEIPERAEHQWTSLFRRETIPNVIRTRFQIPVLVSFQVTYAQCWKAQKKEAAYPVYRIWQGRVDINVNFFWETNNSKTIKPKSASRRDDYFAMEAGPFSNM